MSRIRSIHPGLFSDESFMSLTIDNPICIPLLLGLWTEADDDGVFEWKPLTIKAKVLPAAMVDVTAMLDVLLGLNFILKYDAAGKTYGAIRNFKTWQRPKQPKVRYPKTPIVESYVGSNGEGLPHRFPTDGEMSPQREEGGGRRKEEQEEKPSVSDKKAVRWQVGQKVPAEWAKRVKARFPAVEDFRFQSQIRQFEDYWPGQTSKPSAAKTDWETALVMWMRKAFAEFEVTESEAGERLVVLPADHPDFLAVQAARGTTITVGKSGKMTFLLSEIEQARSAA